MRKIFTVFKSKGKSKEFFLQNLAMSLQKAKGAQAGRGTDPLQEILKTKFSSPKCFFALCKFIA